jgi:hypothetical protein
VIVNVGYFVILNFKANLKFIDRQGGDIGDFELQKINLIKIPGFGTGAEKKDTRKCDP